MTNGTTNTVEFTAWVRSAKNKGSFCATTFKAESLEAAIEYLENLGQEIEIGKDGEKSIWEK